MAHYIKNKNKNMDDTKIVDIVFDNGDENLWETVEEDLQEEPTLSFQEISDASEPWYVRILAVLFLGLALFGALCALCAVLASAPFALVSHLCNQTDWRLSLQRWWARFRRCLVISLVCFVAVFSLRFGLSILMLYFSLYDPLPNLVGSVMGKLVRE